MSVPVLAHGTTGRLLARRYRRNDRKVVRIIRLTAVFLALITPSAPRKGWCEPPIAASSFESAIMVWGVPHTMAPSTRMTISRCTLIGIQVALAIACHSLMVAGSVVGVMSRGGDIMYVSHEFAMNITIVPHTFSRMPSVQWTHLGRPYFQRSQP